MPCGSEKKVQNTKDSLGAPDGRYAEILPGGFRFAPAYSGYLNCGRTGVFMIRISNVSTKPLLVDAMIGYGGKEI